MPINTLYTTGIHEELLTFDTDEERVSWYRQVRDIKAESARLFEKREAEGLTADIRDLYYKWMDTIKGLKATLARTVSPKTSNGH